MRQHLDHGVLIHRLACVAGELLERIVAAQADRDVGVAEQLDGLGVAVGEAAAFVLIRAMASLAMLELR